MKRHTLEVAGKTDPGCVRERNEDSLAINADIGLLVVADGMGGHNSGEVASSLATATVGDFVRQMIGGVREVVPEGDPRQSVRAKQLVHCVRGANTIIYEKARAFPRDHGMGTTIVAAVVEEKTVTVAHVGDSRFYVLRNGLLQRLTEDHSLVMDQVKHGLITAEQADHHHLQNILTRALGTEERVEVDVADHPVLPGDVFLLCTDGLTKEMPEADVAKVLVEMKSAQEAVDRLIAGARNGGGGDNITVVVARQVPASSGVKAFFTHLFKKPGE
jgi:protein phosphatase